MTLTDLEERFPGILWREPVMIKVEGAAESHYGCRVCIALEGIAGRDVIRLPRSLKEWEEHFLDQHGSLK
jgi:hypothetical protein